MRKILLLLLMSGLAKAQTLATYTGVIKDLSQQVVTSGQVTFTLTPSSSSTIPGTGTFTPSTVTCGINVDGTLSGLVAGVSSGSCNVTMNTAISPTGTAYRVCIQPYFVTPGSCFYDYAYSSKDITTIVPTLQTGPINYAGAQGPPIPFLGSWNSSTVYTLGQAVSYNNAVYISLTNPNLNNTPSSSAANWSAVVSPASLMAAPTTGQTVVQPAGTTFAANSLNGVFNEELFAGSTVPDRVNAAITACGSDPCYITIPNYAPTNPTGLNWSTTYGTNISIEDQRYSNGLGFANNAVPDFHYYHQYIVYAQGLQPWEQLPGTNNSGPWGLDIETTATDEGTQPDPHDGIHGNTGGLTIYANRLGGNRGLWGENINVQYANFSNVANGMEIDLSNNNPTNDDPGDGSAGIALNIIGGSATGKRSGVAILIGNVASQGPTTGFVTGIGVNAYSQFGINLASNSAKVADISIGLPDADPAKVAIAVSSSSIANSQFAVFDDGSVNAVNVRGQTVRSIGAPSTASVGGQIAFGGIGSQEMDLISVHTSGAPGGFNFFSSQNGGALGASLFSITPTGVAWGATGTTISDSAVVAQIGTVTVGQVACIKATNPRTIGYCSGAVSGTSSCTCN